MALSSSYNYNLTRDEIITSALRKLGVVADGDSVTVDQLSVGAKALNSVLKAWGREGIKLWNVEIITQTFTASSVVVGTDTNDYECIRNLTSSASSKPIDGADYSTYWKATGGSGSGAVYADATAYRSISNYSLDTNVIGVEEAFIRREYNDTPVTIISRENFLHQGNKFTEGLPSQIYFRVAHTPEIFLYPYPSLTTDVLHMSVVRRPQDFDSGTDEPDVLAGWLRALEFTLAADLGFNYGKQADEVRTFRAEGLRMKQSAIGGTQEISDLVLQPILGE